MSDRDEREPTEGKKPANAQSSSATSATTSDSESPSVVRPRRRKKSTKRRVLLGVGIVVLIGMIGVTTASVWGLWSYNQVRRVEVELAEREPTEPQNFLIVGSDSRDGIDHSDDDAGVMIGGETPAGQRSDSLMVARLDPDSERVDLLSIPRDLWVTISPSGKEQRINTAYAHSAQATVDTVQDVLGIPIHHFVEVDFVGFRDLIDSLGGVPMYFDRPVRDTWSGLDIRAPGCHVLTGQQGLAFARSRHLEHHDGSKWRTDPTSDLGRMSRQQLLVKASMRKANTLGLNNVVKLKGLVDATVASVALDNTLGVTDIVGLGQKLSGLDPERIQTHSLPVTPHRVGKAQVELLEVEAAQPILNIFRGTTVPTTVTTTTAPPPSNNLLTVNVFNGTGVDGEGRRISYVLDAGLFNIDEVETWDNAASRSVIEHHPDQAIFGEVLARWIHPTPELRVDEDLEKGAVNLRLGEDFERIFEPGEEQSGSFDGEAESDEGEIGVSDNHDGGTRSELNGENGEVAVTTTTTTIAPGWTPAPAPQGVECT